MRANWLRYTILDWLQQAPQTFYALLDKLWEIDQTVDVFEVVEVITSADWKRDNILRKMKIEQAEK